MSNVESSARAPLAFRGLSYWEASVIAICSQFCSPEGVINSFCGNCGFFLTWGLRYTNADLKIFLYVGVHIKTIRCYLPAKFVNFLKSRLIFILFYCF